MKDTPALIEKIVIEGYRKMTSWEKMKRVSELNKAVQQLALSRIRKQYGDIPEQEQKLRLASLWMDRNTIAEDIILSKLQWYKSGGCVSERQWNDVLGVLRIVDKRLDFIYLQDRAKKRGLKDLLDEVLAQVADS